MKHLFIITITQKLLETNSDSYKENIGDEMITYNYQWSNNERNAIRKSMADYKEYLNIGLDNSSLTKKPSILEVKETSMKVKFTNKEITDIVEFSFLAK